jgi:hypothetical protein
VRALTQISFQTLEQRSRVNTRRQGETLAADLSQSSCIAKIRSLADDCAGNFHLDIYIFLRDPHVLFSFLLMDTT